MLAAPVLQGGTAPGALGHAPRSRFRARRIGFVLVRDAGMADYNLRYMGCHGPTNVLSFPIDEQIAGPEDEDVPVQLGSLVFSVDTLHRETLLYGQDPEEHCLRLLAHGLGHLAGYDHGPEMDELCSEMLSAAEAWLTAQ
ncbi:rRNA maturation RNase YbeY [Bilophila wadsworthia]|uniref:rRNA maturation RNase YbeY n=1 Tax=Bilophila wadsworthia TaxID=35833 RepID=UPI003F49789A